MKNNLAHLEGKVAFFFLVWLYLQIDLFTDSDSILNFCPVDFCLKWILYFVSTSNFMKEYQFSRLFDFGKLGFDHEKFLIYNHGNKLLDKPQNLRECSIS